MERLNFIRNGGETKRYHTRPVLREQNVAEHSFHVAMIAAWLAGQEPPGVGSNLLMAALTHDLAEHQMGDLPAPTKRSLPGYWDNAGQSETSFRKVWGGLENDILREKALDFECLLTPQEAHWLKLADNADGCFYCIRERAMGNRLIVEVFNNFYGYAKTLAAMQARPVPNYELDLIHYIAEEWEKVNG